MLQIAFRVLRIANVCERASIRSAYVCMYVFMALITTLVLCARSQNLIMSVSERRVHVVFSIAGFKGVRKPCRQDT